MKPRRLPEVRALIAQPEFQDWWRSLQSGRKDAESALARYDELLSQTTLMEFRAELTQKNAIDTLYKAGECEDAAANMLFESTDLENRSFRVIADFEEQRYRVSELWYRLGAAEKNLDERKELAAKEKSRKADAELRTSEALLRKASEDYERETAVKTRLWEEVERIWAKAAEVSLLMAEQRVRGKKIRREAEGMFSLAEERKARAKALRTEAEGASAACEAAQSRVEALLQHARERFDCSAGTDFLYFRHRDNAKLAYCVCLIEDHDNYNVELRPLMLYAVDRQRGAAFLEPARADSPSVEEGDRRFEEYFLRGRKGEARSAGA